ncbi:MAG TPA: hypothetical protein VF399_11225 [bacterium]
MTEIKQPGICNGFDYFVVVREKTTGKEVERIRIDETTPGSKLDDELQILQQLTVRVMESRYRPDRYEIQQIKEQKDKNAFFSMTASRGSLLIVNLGGVIVGIILLLLLLFIRTIFTLGLFIIGSFIIALYMLVDYLMWHKNGVRMVTVDGQGIALRRGEALISSRILKEQVSQVNVYYKLNRAQIVIFTGGTPEKVAPGVTLFTGPRVRLTNDAFADRDFDEFIKTLKGLGYPVKNS